DGQLSDLFRNNARRTASERFSLDRMLENYEDLYVRLLSNAPVLSEGTSGLPSAAGGQVYQQLESGHASSAPDLERQARPRATAAALMARMAAVRESTAIDRHAALASGVRTLSLPGGSRSSSRGTRNEAA